MSIKTKAKILLVEDEASLARVLNLKLVNEGFDCTAVNDGNDAFEVLKKEKFDLILLDLILPGMDGFQILENMKTAGIKTKIIVLSNLNQQADIDRVKKLGAVNFFVKSNIQLSEIINYVKSLLPKR
jgi:two-component system alkaline phosphatase synthesis response regulator PhoP